MVSGVPESLGEWGLMCVSEGLKGLHGAPGDLRESKRVSRALQGISETFRRVQKDFKGYLLRSIDLQEEASGALQEVSGATQEVSRAF